VFSTHHPFAWDVEGLILENTLDERGRGKITVGTIGGKPRYSIPHRYFGDDLVYTFNEQQKG
jgi:hypothetical protein